MTLKLLKKRGDLRTIKMRPIKSNKKSKLALKLALYLQVLPHATLAEESSILTGASVV